MSFRLPFGRDLSIYRPTVKKVIHSPIETCEKFSTGDRIIFDPSCSCEGCLLIEKWYLKRGESFTVKAIIEKNGWVTVELIEVPDKFFSSVMFKKQVDKTKTGH